MCNVLKISLITDEAVTKQTVSLVINTDIVLCPEVWGPYPHSSFVLQELSPASHLSITHRAAKKCHKLPLALSSNPVNLPPTLYILIPEYCGYGPIVPIAQYHNSLFLNLYVKASSLLKSLPPSYTTFYAF